MNLETPEGGYRERRAQIKRNSDVMIVVLLNREHCNDDDVRMGDISESEPCPTFSKHSDFIY